MKTFTLTILILGLTGQLCLAQSDGDSGLPNTGGEDTNLPSGPVDPTPATDPDTNPIPSTCLTAQMRFRWIMCDNDGYYRPLQCINATLCRCVDRFFGRNSTGFFPRSGNEGRCVRSLDCQVMMNGETRQVPHGLRRNLMINDTCYLIECNNGTLNRSRSRGCRTQVKPDAKCTYEGRDFDIGQTVKIGCRTCKCASRETGDPTFECPKIRCPNEQDSCKCDDVDTDPVCVNGITLRARCLASCRDEDDSGQVTPGDCRSMDSCQGRTCNGGQVCHRREARCLLRNCTQYSCSACDNSPDPSLRVCGSDGTTYDSRCHLERESERRFVRYQGECNTTRCPVSAVCGVDGVTYRSRCDAAFRNVRIDYNGRCQKSADDARAQCESLENCNNRVSTSRALCPICGGIVTAALDRSVVSEFVSANPGENLDSLAGLMAYANRTIALFYRLARIYGCNFEYDITVSQQPELIYRAMDQRRGLYCADAATILTNYLNGVARPNASELNTGTELLNQIPPGDTQENFVSAMFSTAAPNYNQQQLENPTSGTPAVVAVAMVTTFLAVILAVLNNV